MEYYCHYIDYKFFEAQKIGNLYSELNKFKKHREHGVLLSTCQRIENYTTTKENTLDHLGLPFRMVEGREDVTKRLTAIASGLESQILGERSIWFQVEKACVTLSEDHAIAPLFNAALVTAARIRNSTPFCAALGYEDIALKVLAEDGESKGGEPAANLIVVGGGMLARNFSKASIRECYDNIHFITRDPKALRKGLYPLQTGKTFNRMESLTL